MAADLNFAVSVCFISRGLGENKTAKVFALNTALKGASLLYIFFNRGEFSCRIHEFVAKHEDLCFYRDSSRWSLWGQIFGSEKLLPKQ